MSNSNRESIFEIFSLQGKHILCCVLDEEYIDGMIKRGSTLWFDVESKERVVDLQVYSKCKEQINFVLGSAPQSFDHVIVNDPRHSILGKNDSFSAGASIIIISGIYNVIKWNLWLHKLFSHKDKTSYSVVPSFENVKLVIPEGFGIQFERYWTLRSLNPVRSMKLLAEWLSIKSSFLRKLCFDKVIVLK
jgi:hypothetical protein